VNGARAAREHRHGRGVALRLAISVRALRQCSGKSEFMSHLTHLDDHSDLAALVYRDGEDPDCVLRDFSRALIAQGRRVVGLVQARTHCLISATLLPTGETIELSQALGHYSQSCALDTDRLAQAAVYVQNGIVAGSDLVVINRFGKLEAQGKGLLDELAQAVAADTPVVIAVPQHRFEDWLRFSGGMSVKLGCCSSSLHQWWNAVSRDGDPRPAADPPTYCEYVK
jgi:hypothetical protein